MKKILCVMLFALMLLSLFSCSGKKTALTFTSEADFKNIKDVVKAEMSVEGYGDIILELYHDTAPKTVENFVKLASEGFYDGTVFHRIISGFMIQGGDDDGDGIGGSAETIYGEFAINGFQNSLSHERGVISMARTGQDYNSASSQFFIMHADGTSLDGQYAAFGKVVEGLDVVDKIAAVSVSANQYGEASVPNETVKIDHVIIFDQFDREGPDAAEGDGALETKPDEEIYADPIKVEMSIKNHGVITLELYPNLAPITVDNFITLAKSGFYDGLTFHRIIKDFMIQGGDPEGTGMGGSDKQIKGEFTANGVYNPLKHDRGVISMARGGYSMDSASSQFFIVHKDSPHLDGQYAAFGKVIEGIEVVDSVASVEVEADATGSSSSPVTPVILEYVKVLEDTTADSADDTVAPTETTAAEETTAASEIK